MTFVDTHSHLYDEAFDSDRIDVIQRTLDADVKLMLLPDIDSDARPRLEYLYASHPDIFRQMIGLHPSSVKEDFEKELGLVYNKLFQEARHNTYIAVGEIGMDLYWDKTYEEQQRVALERQIGWAIELSLPVCLHVRKAYNEVFGILKKIGLPQYSGVMHCFGGSVQEAHRAIEAGFMLGIGGVVTFKNATMADVVAAVPLESIVLETDAPYLSPVPYRGKRNESAYIPIIAQKVADIKGISIEQVAEQTTENARRLFNL